MNNVSTAVKLIDGTNTIQTYVVVQHKKKAILGIKPELHDNGSEIAFLLRVRAVADPDSIHGIEDRKGYTTEIYPSFPFIKADQKRSSFYINAMLEKATLYGFLNAQNGEVLLKRLVYKLMLNMLSHLQGMSGAQFDKMQDGLEFLTHRFMEDIKKHYEFDKLTEEQLQTAVNTENLEDVMKLPYLN